MHIYIYIYVCVCARVSMLPCTRLFVFSSFLFCVLLGVASPLSFSRPHKHAVSFSIVESMHGLKNNKSLFADTPLKAFAAALLHQRGRDGWHHNALRAVNDGGSVIAGIVLHVPPLDGRCDETGTYVCVSLGSGTRCVGYEIPTSHLEADLLLRDGHAEVMARRGFVAFLLDAASYLVAEESRQHPFVQRCLYVPQLLGKTANEGDSLWRCFRLRDGVTVHLVSTQYPCGAMSIPRGGGDVILATPGGHSLFCASETASTVHMTNKENNSVFCETTTTTTNNSNSANATRDCGDSGRVVICHDHFLAAHRNHPADLLPHVARVKPGKGRQNLCMSCSDKLLRWHCLGLQGRRRARLFPERICFTDIWLLDVTSNDDGVMCKASSQMENACRMLNDRRQCFCPANLSDSGSGTTGSGAGERVLQSLSAPPPVDLCCFAPASLHSLLVERKQEVVEGRDGEEGGRCWSRSAWLTMVVNGTTSALHSVGVKRGRSEDDACKGLSDFLNWAEKGAAVLNTKEGFPRGITKQGMGRAVQQLSRLQHNLSGRQEGAHDASVAILESVVRRYPLSRLWMKQKQWSVMRSLTPGREGALVNVSEWTTGDGGDADDTNSLMEPVLLLPAQGQEGLKGGIVAGGSVHYWLQQASRSRKAEFSVLQGGESVQSLPLLWVKKKKKASG